MVALAQNMLPLALMLTAIAGIVLGMGMPTTPAYIVMVSLLVPALIKLGAIAPAAHMFAFYFAILSAITPPVALAVFAAASLAKTDIWKVGLGGGAHRRRRFHRAVHVRLRAVAADDRRLADSRLLVRHRHHRHHPARRRPVSATCCDRALWWERVLLSPRRLLLIKPGWITDVIGLALLRAGARQPVFRQSQIDAQ